MQVILISVIKSIGSRSDGMELSALFQSAPNSYTGAYKLYVSLISKQTQGWLRAKSTSSLFQSKKSKCECLCVCVHMFARDKQQPNSW